MSISKQTSLALCAGAALLVGAQTAQSTMEFGNDGEAINMVVGYQPYYAEYWSGVFNNGLEL